MVIRQGDVCWADLGEPRGSQPAFRRPIVVVQGDALNQSRLALVVCVPLTSNMKWSAAPGNVVLSMQMTGLAKDSVALGSQLSTVDKTFFDETVGRLDARHLILILLGVDLVLGR